MPAKRSLNILLIDHGEIVYQTISDYLQDSGHSVDRICNACAILKAIQKHDYDLALVDIRILDIDELSLLTEIREIRPEMSVVIITEHQDMGKALQAMQVGVIDFLTKPVKLLELDAVLEKCVRNRALMVKCMQAEKALREIERRYRVLAENVTDVVWITDINLQSIYVNPAVTHMLGYSVEEAMMLAWGDIFTPASFKIIEEILPGELGEPSQNNPLRLQSLDLELLRKDGSILCVKAKCTSLRDPDGNPVGILGILCDSAICMEARSSGNQRQTS